MATANLIVPFLIDATTHPMLMLARATADRANARIAEILATGYRQPDYCHVRHTDHGPTVTFEWRADGDRLILDAYLDIDHRGEIWRLTDWRDVVDGEPMQGLAEGRDGVPAAVARVLTQL